MMDKVSADKDTLEYVNVNLPWDCGSVKSDSADNGGLVEVMQVEENSAISKGNQESIVELGRLRLEVNLLRKKLEEKDGRVNELEVRDLDAECKILGLQATVKCFEVELAKEKRLRREAEKKCKVMEARIRKLGGGSLENDMEGDGVMEFEREQSNDEIPAVVQPPVKVRKRGGAQRKNSDSEDYFAVDDNDDDDDDVVVIGEVTNSKHPRGQFDPREAPNPEPSPGPSFHSSDVPYRHRRNWCFLGSSSSSRSSSSVDLDPDFDLGDDSLETIQKEHKLTKISSNGRHHCSCGLSYVDSSGLKQHIRQRIIGKIFHCKECTNKYDEHGKLKRHVQEVHNVKYSGGDHACGNCARTFLYKGELNAHKRVCKRKIIY